MRTLLLSLAILFLSGCSGGHWDLFEKNDYFKFDKNRDENFTQGFFLRKTRENDSFSVSQDLYTPDGIDQPKPPKGERPFAGVLAGEYSRFLRGEDGELDIARVKVGCIGKCSFAGKTQQFMHHYVFNGRDPTGWDDNQFSNEIIANLAYERNYRSEPRTLFGWHTDIVSNIRGDVGTLDDVVSGQAIFRIGHNLPSGYSPVQINQEKSTDDFKFFVFTGGQSKVVFYNATLDGPAFGSNKNFEPADKETFVNIFKIGFYVQAWGKRFSYTWNRSTPEFSGGGSHSFGTVNIGWEF